MKSHFKRITIISVPVFCLWAAALFSGCQPDITGVVGPSTSGFKIGIAALAGDAGLPADGVSKATIRVEVFTAIGESVDGAKVTLTATLGTLASSSLTTTKGTAVTTLTSGTTPGTAYIVATVENASATATVQFVNFVKKVA